MRVFHGLQFQVNLKQLPHNFNYFLIADLFQKGFP